MAKEKGDDRVLGVSMWLCPQPAGHKQSWYEWFEDWRLWFNQLGMNLWYGRGGLNVKVSKTLPEFLPVPALKWVKSWKPLWRQGWKFLLLVRTYSPRRITANSSGYRKKLLVSV